MPAPDSKPSAFTRFRALLALLIALLIGAALIIAMTWWVVGSAPRSQAVAEREGVSVSEFAALPDEDAYPAALAIAADGTVYTGSYQSGALWSISPEGVVSEIAETRARIGSITGLDLAPDGALYILDRLSALESKGAVIWRYHGGGLHSVVQIPADPSVGVMLPDDIAVDSAGLIYISDRAPARVWRYSSAGENLGMFWRPPAGEQAAPTGLAYDARRKSILISDSAQDALYRVPASASELAQAVDATETLINDQAQKGYGFDGIAVTPTGEIYLALLAWNRAARLQNGELQLLARDFRGASDLVYDAARHRLIVTNWNQFSLGFGTVPQLPFALDAVALEA